MMELRERVARKIAEAFTGWPPDTIVQSEWPPLIPARLKGNFIAMKPGLPLYQFFLATADAAIAETQAYIDEGD
jgi:hypothetical protein